MKRSVIQGIPRFVRPPTIPGFRFTSSRLLAAGLDKAAEAAEAFDLTIYLTSGEQEAPEGWRKTWFGAYEKVDPTAPDYYKALRLQEQKRQGLERSKPK